MHGFGKHIVSRHGRISNGNGYIPYIALSYPLLPCILVVSAVFVWTWTNNFMVRLAMNPCGAKANVLKDRECEVVISSHCGLPKQWNVFYAFKSTRDKNHESGLPALVPFMGPQRQCSRAAVGGDLCRRSLIGSDGWFQRIPNILGIIGVHFLGGQLEYTGIIIQGEKRGFTSAAAIQACCFEPLAAFLQSLQVSRRRL